MARTGALFAITLSLLGGPVLAAEPAESGKVLYLRHCGACHGPAGKGDGIAGTFMRTRPADLTGFAKRDGGRFPARKVMEIIDGRNTVRAHGDPDMPVWGEIFQDQAAWDVRRRTDVQEKVRLITEHIGSIQEK